MKELSIEEKAKAYDKAYKKVAVRFGFNIADEIFPEFRESEDEKIRKEMIFYFTEEIPQCSIQEHSDKMRVFISWLKRQEVERTKLELKSGNSYFCYKSRWERADSETFKKGLIYKCNKDGVLDNFVIKNPEQHFIEIKDERIVWLEKQGEQKHKIQPKFKIGDIIRFKGNETLKGEAETHKIVSYDNELYVFADGTTDLFCEQDLYELVEQNLADKVEPKFHEGEWIIIDGETMQIESVGSKAYNIKDGGIIPFRLEHEMHLWSIQDAKDGDVLATLDYILIFEAIISKNSGVSYCHYDFGCSTPQFDFNKDDNWYFGKEAIIHPATKEQRDLLFAKMKEAGYEWDAEKKELKKIEQTSAWSEEDEERLRDIINELVVIKEDANVRCSERALSDIIADINWLKSLRPQSQWKPSDEQMAQLHKYCPDNRPLTSLYKQLKKLMEE